MPVPDIDLYDNVESVQTLIDQARVVTPTFKFEKVNDVWKIKIVKCQHCTLDHYVDIPEGVDRMSMIGKVINPACTVYDTTHYVHLRSDRYDESL